MFVVLKGNIGKSGLPGAQGPPGEGIQGSKVRWNLLLNIFVSE